MWKLCNLFALAFQADFACNANAIFEDGVVGRFCANAFSMCMFLVEIRNISHPWGTELN